MSSVASAPICMQHSSQILAVEQILPFCPLELLEDFHIRKQLCHTGRIFVREFILHEIKAHRWYNCQHEKVFPGSPVTVSH